MKYGEMLFWEKQESVTFPLTPPPPPPPPWDYTAKK